MIILPEMREKGLDKGFDSRPCLPFDSRPLIYWLIFVFQIVIHSLVWQPKTMENLISVETGDLRTWYAGEGSPQVRGSIPVIVLQSHLQ